MNPVKNYSKTSASSFNSAKKLPSGGYVLKILDAKEENYTWGDVVVLRFDIVEGEFKDFFAKQYNAMPDAFKKWKGTYRLIVPQQKSDSEEDIEKYHRSLGFFKYQIEAVNSSNNINIDCSKEWDIAVFKNRLVGAVFGEKEWAMNGKTGWYTSCDHLVPVNDIRENSFTIPEDKPLKNKTPEPVQNNDMSAFEEILGDGYVPF